MTPLQIVQGLLSAAFVTCAWILCAESRRNLIRAQAAATRANTAAERAEAAAERAEQAEWAARQATPRSKQAIAEMTAALRTQRRSGP